MSEEQRNIYMLAQIAIFNATVAGMVAENNQRQICGHSLAYTEDAFQKLIDESMLHHNAVITELLGH